jgi:hypothetical protein
LAELLKLGIKVSQATVGRYMPWRPKIPSPTWRSFPHNHLTDIAAIAMFVVAKPSMGKCNQIPVTAKSILFGSLRACDVHYMFQYSHKSNRFSQPIRYARSDRHH